MWIVDKIKGLFNSFIRGFKSLIAAALPLAKQVIMGQLADIGDKVVAELDDISTLTNAQKREEAFKRIKEFSVSRGIAAKDHLIYLLIELTVSKFKELKQAALDEKARQDAADEDFD